LSSTLHLEFESKAKTGSEQQTKAPTSIILRMKFS
jgi:hypothetical protein